ncbi:MAG: Coenzyme F420 hydrogenase/dehydrogenase, beta subunit C-terminal domain [Lachnospiraceae bacterium]|nr:Coenzyme F420 hydrogenase/dehydrogenase, beta subunit C-terminal domain [Lachnospiraceae bacterium]
MLHIENVWLSENDTNPDKSYKCCGCGVCENNCPNQAITMHYDNEGFLYPRLDEKKCIECGKCLEVCPISNNPEAYDYLHTYAGYSNESAIVDNCASGGVCTAISRYVIEHGGVVFGVKYSDSYIKSEYTKAETIESLKDFMTSKYVQSRKDMIFKSVREEVKKGRLVLFIGCPCDISALVLYLGTGCENLLTCELICMGVTSYKVAEAYINPRVKKWGKLTELNSKDKKYGWFVPCLKEVYRSGKKMSKPFFGTYYGYGFTKFQRPSCAKCPYRGKIGRGDIRMGDFWGIQKSDSFWNMMGVSSIFARTEKGNQLLTSLKNNNFSLYEVPYEKAAVNNNMDLSKNYSETQWKVRNEFVDVLLTKGLKPACRKTATWEFWIKHFTPPVFANILKHLRHTLTDKKVL